MTDHTELPITYSHQASLPTSVQDLDALIRAKRPESLHLEYKRSIALLAAKNEIAKDISAFANADGGLLIYGIIEDENMPTGRDDGLPLSDFSREQLEALAMSRITPKIAGLRVSAIPLANGNSAYAVLVPKAVRVAHQDSHNKRYYKRHDFSSVAMEHYEILDVANRVHAVAPLIAVDVEVHRLMAFLTVTNTGSDVAYDVAFQFTPMIHWRRERELPPLLASGAKSISPGRTYRYFYNTFPVILDDSNDVEAAFDIRAAYLHGAGRVPVAEEFHIDFRDFLYTHPQPTETGDLEKSLANQLKEINRSIEGLKSAAEKLTPIAGATGLAISVTTLRSLLRTNAGGPPPERIHPLLCDWSAFREVAGASPEIACRIHEQFAGGGGMQGVRDLDGVTDDVARAIEDAFVDPEA